VREIFAGPAVRGDREIVWTLVAIAFFDLCAGAYPRYSTSLDPKTALADQNLTALDQKTSNLPVAS